MQVQRGASTTEVTYVFKTFVFIRLEANFLWASEIPVAPSSKYVPAWPCKGRWPCQLSSQSLGPSAATPSPNLSHLQQSRHAHLDYLQRPDSLQGTNGIYQMYRGAYQGHVPRARTKSYRYMATAATPHRTVAQHALAPTNGNVASMLVAMAHIKHKSVQHEKGCTARISTTQTCGAERPSVKGWCAQRASVHSRT